MPPPESAKARPSVLILRAMPAQIDGPTQRQARFLAREYDVTVMALGENPFAGEAAITWMPMETRGSRIPLRDGRRLWLERLGPLFPRLWPAHLRLTHQWRYMEHFAQSRPWDIVVCNDVDTLLPGLAAKRANRKCKFILAIRDHPTRMSDSKEPAWRRRQRRAASILRKHGREAHAVVTVADSFPQMLQDDFGLRRATVVYNAPELADTSAISRINDGRLHLLHHGVCDRERELELLIETGRLLGPEFQIHLMLTPRDAAYQAELEALAAPLGDQVEFLPPVPAPQIAAAAARFHLGIHFQPGKSFNALHAMPNKFFDFIMAGLGIVAGPYAEMGPFIAREKIGWTTKTFDPAQAAALIRGLSPEAITQAQTASQALRLRINAETEMSKWLDIARKLKPAG